VGTFCSENSNNNKVNREDALLSQQYVGVQYVGVQYVGVQYVGVQYVGVQSGVSTFIDLQFCDGNEDEERLNYLLEPQIFFGR